MTDDLIPAVEGEPKPDGYIGIVDQLGHRWWMNQEVLTRQPPTTLLSPDQIERIRAFKEVLSEHDRTSLETAVDNFRRDGHPEREIRLWEAVAEVYRVEVHDRPSAGEAERRLLFSALLQATFGLVDAPAAVEQDSQLARLPDLARVLSRFRDAVKQS